MQNGLLPIDLYCDLTLQNVEPFILTGMAMERGAIIPAVAEKSRAWSSEAGRGSLSRPNTVTSWPRRDSITLQNPANPAT